MNLDGSNSNATPIGDISIDILKSTVDTQLPFITNQSKKVVFLKNLSLLK